MTLTRRTDLQEGVGWPHSLVEALDPVEDLALRPWAEIGKVEIFPGVPLDGEIVVPAHYMPDSTTRRLSYRTLDLSLDGRITGPEDPRNEALRRALLAFVLVRQTGTGLRVYKPTSWLIVARRLFRMAIWVLDNERGPAGILFDHLRKDDVERMLVDLSRDRRDRSDLELTIRNLQEARERGIVADAPPVDVEEHTDDGPRLEPRIKGAPLLVPKDRAPERNWKPFPDDFVSAFLWRALWLQENLGEQIIACWQELRRIAQDAENRGRSTAHPDVVAARKAALTDFEWRDATGGRVDTLPFPITFGGEATQSWPPKSAKYFNSVIAILQTLNLCAVAFCSGARESELGSARESSLILNDGEARLAGTTFKLAEEIGGENRDWPLHPAAVRALRLQTLLAREVRPEGRDHLWVMAAKAGSEPLGSQLLNLTEPLVNAAKALGLTHLAGDDRPHLHRWRHTVGRLVALTIVSAPQVLLDLFGHRDLEMTLTYMLADPEIARTTLKVAEEFAAAMAEEAVAETLEGRTSGPAAAPLRDGLFSLGLKPSDPNEAPPTAMRDGEDQYGVTTLREATEILTVNRRYWALVRPGVICTKSLGQVGPCTQGRGEPDPGACRTGCTHRLERASAQAQCRRSLDELLVEHEAAVSEGLEMVVANLEGQIRENLGRWDEARDAVIATNATAARIWAEAAP